MKSGRNSRVVWNIWIGKRNFARKLRTDNFTRNRVHRLCWHGENRAVASHSTYPQVLACSICHRFWSQEHAPCDCPSTTDARLGGSLDLTITVSRLTPGPMLGLGRHFQSLLIVHNQPNLMASHWSGQWDARAIESLKLWIARCNSSLW